MALDTLRQAKLLQVNYMELPCQVWIQGLVSLQTSMTNTGQCWTSLGRVGDGDEDQEHPASPWPVFSLVTGGCMWPSLSAGGI